MHTITGTTGSDTLIGTIGQDLFLPLGVQTGGPADSMSGLAGSDTYDLARGTPADATRSFVIDDRGGSDGIDRVLGPGALVQSASLGYLGFAGAERRGDDLILTTPGKPYRYHDPAKPSYQVTIIDHYGDGTIERFQAGAIVYRLPTGALGTRHADIMAGSRLDDDLNGRGGDDYITGNRGADHLSGGGGADYLLGGTGADLLEAGSGDDHVYAGSGRDTVLAGAGSDYVQGQDGNDVIRGQGGNDLLYGQDGRDRLFGGNGQDLLDGGADDDRLQGGQGGDTYRYGYDVDALGYTAGGHDIIFDDGEAPSYNDFDRIELFGYYGPSSGGSAEAYARLAFLRDGLDMVMTSDGSAGSIRVIDQFGSPDHAIEELHFNAGYWTPLRFKILDGARTDLGDDRAYRFGEGGEWNEIMFGTDGADTVFGNSGVNFIWLGDGADTLIYKEADPNTLGGTGGGACIDIVMDFDATEDRMDFTEIKGLVFADLVISTAADGDASVSWTSGTWEISNIYIELRGVSATDLTANNFEFG